MRSTGAASTKIAITVPVSTTTGWAMTQSDQRRQNRLSPCLRPRTRSEFTRWPSNPSSAGSSVSAESTEKSTTTEPPMPIERSDM